jgi:hypothetical protein
MLLVVFVLNGFGITGQLMASPAVSGQPEGSSRAVTDTIAIQQALPDSTAGNLHGQALRGTRTAVPRGATALQYTGRALLFVPYALIEVVAWPLEQLVRFGERSETARDVVDFLDMHLYWGKFKVGLYLQLATDAGSPAPGIQGTMDGWAGPNSELNLVAGYWNKHRNQLEFELLALPGRQQYHAMGGLSNREDQPFYGVGPDTPNIEYVTNQQRKLLEGTAAYHLGGALGVGLTGYYRDTDLSSPSDDDRSVAEGFPEAFERARNGRYLGVEGGIAFDTRNRAALSSSGSYLRFFGGYNFAQLSPDADYSHYALELQQFINFYHHNRVLALRAYAGGIDTNDPVNLPYTELERLGGDPGMRGYARNRFADRTQLVLTAEYRYRISSFFLGNLFVDWGSVAPEWKKMRLADISPSYGLALGFMQRRPVALQFAVSREGWQVYFGFGSVFRAQSRRLR